MGGGVGCGGARGVVVFGCADFEMSGRNEKRAKKARKEAKKDKEMDAEQEAAKTDDGEGTAPEDGGPILLSAGTKRKRGGGASASRQYVQGCVRRRRGCGGLKGSQ
jgi:hypothetical protein